MHDDVSRNTGNKSTLVSPQKANKINKSNNLHIIKPITITSSDSIISNTPLNSDRSFSSTITIDKDRMTTTKDDELTNAKKKTKLLSVEQLEQQIIEMKQNSLKPRRKIVIDPQKKLEILEMCRGGVAVSSLAKHFSVGEQTIRDWKRQEKKIRDIVERNAMFNSNRKHAVGMNQSYPETYDALRIWYFQQR